MVTLSDLLRQDNRRRVILVELDYVAEVSGAPVTQTLYMADSIAPLQTDDATIYEDCINSVPNFQRSLSGPISTVYSSSLGSVEVDNADGQKDFLLSVALDGSQVRFYVWDAGVSTLVFVALALRASAPSFDRISVALKDAGVLLNKSVGGEALVGGTGPNAERWRPLNFGYVHNIQAQIYDEPGLIYVHSDTGLNTYTPDVRDKGVSVLFNDLADGTFELLASPAGIVTCDVFASYDGTDATRRVSDLLTFLVQDRLSANAGEGFFGAGPTFTVGDADDYIVAISIPEARNIVDVLNQVCDSGNAFWAILRTGEFTFGRLRPNSIGDFGFITATITLDDIDEGSWHIDHDAPLYYLLQAYMSRNWYKQTDFANVLTPDEQAVFTRPGIFLLQDTAVGMAYADIPEAYDKTLSISPAIDTLLSGAFGELDLPYLADWMETRRFMQLPWIERLSITVGLEYYFLELGDPVAVFADRYGMDEGPLYQVLSININLTKAKIDLILIRRHTPEPLPPGWVRITQAGEGGPPVAKPYSPLINVIPPPGAGPCGKPFLSGGDIVIVPCGGGGVPVEPPLDIPHQGVPPPLFIDDSLTDVLQTTAINSTGTVAVVGNPELNWIGTSSRADGGIIVYQFEVSGLWTAVYTFDLQAEGGLGGEGVDTGQVVSIADGSLHFVSTYNNDSLIPSFIFFENTGINTWAPVVVSPAGSAFTDNLDKIKISRDGDTIIVGVDGVNKIEILQGGPGSWAIADTYTGGAGDYFTDFAMSPDATTVVISNMHDTGSGIEGRIEVLKLAAGPSWINVATITSGVNVTATQSYRPIVVTPAGGLDGAWTATGSEVIVALSVGSDVEVWRVDPLGVSYTQWDTISGAVDPSALTLSDDGQTLVIGDIGYNLAGNTGRVMWTADVFGIAPTANIDTSPDFFEIGNPYLASSNDSQWGRSLMYASGEWLIAGSRYPEGLVDFYQADFSLFLLPPANDDFDDAVTLTAGGPVSNVVLDGIPNRWAGAEVGEPDHAATTNGASHSLWWKVTLASSGNVSFDTSLSLDIDGSSPLDTVLAIYSGSTVGTLVEIDSNDDGGVDVTSELISVPLTGGVTYHIAVGSFDPIIYGTVILRYSLPGATL